MNIDIRDTITLDYTNEYVVGSKAIFQNNTYYYLVGKNDNTEIKFCVEKVGANNTLVEVTDENLNQRLLPLFLQNVEPIISQED